MFLPLINLPGFLVVENKIKSEFAPMSQLDLANDLDLIFKEENEKDTKIGRLSVILKLGISMR